MSACLQQKQQHMVKQHQKTVKHYHKCASLACCRLLNITKGLKVHVCLPAAATAATSSQNRQGNHVHHPCDIFILSFWSAKPPTQWLGSNKGSMLTAQVYSWNDTESAMDMYARLPHKMPSVADSS